MELHEGRQQDPRLLQIQCAHNYLRDYLGMLDLYPILYPFFNLPSSLLGRDYVVVVSAMGIHDYR